MMSFAQHDSAPLRELTPRDDATSQRFPLAHVLLLDAEAVTANLALFLRGTYSVSVSSSVRTGRECLHRSRPALIITELDLADGAGTDICREAKALPHPPTVLITTGNVERVPEALDARCDGVLLKPFAPNLLVARVGRLVNGRSQPTRGSIPSGTNRFWQDMQCPYCYVNGVTSFEFTSRRRAWYACARCKKVWLGKRLE